MQQLQNLVKRKFFMYAAKASIESFLALCFSAWETFVLYLTLDFSYAKNSKSVMINASDPYGWFLCSFYAGTIQQRDVCNRTIRDDLLFSPFVFRQLWLWHY